MGLRPVASRVGTDAEDGEESGEEAGTGGVHARSCPRRRRPCLKSVYRSLWPLEEGPKREKGRKSSVRLNDAVSNVPENAGRASSLGGPAGGGGLDTELCDFRRRRADVKIAVFPDDTDDTLQ